MDSNCNPKSVKKSQFMKNDANRKLLENYIKANKKQQKPENPI